ncbi:nucleolar complex protein 2 homolog [Ornithodoros turicata]|uniref:nucleolar complex protein 2 homolog n=1 Tax=Ornithodoros turicata TaxID=34597 RepID=UPI003139A8EF
MGRISRKGKYIRNIKYAVTTKKQQAREAAARREESESSEPEFEEEFEDDDDEDEPLPLHNKSEPGKHKAKKEISAKKTKVKQKEKAKEADDGSSGDESDMDMEKHKEIVRSLKDKDPDFYDYLKEHDKELLDFYENDKVDEDETEIPDKVPDTESVTMSHISKYREALQQKPTVRVVSDVVSLFRAAVIQAEGGEESQTKGFYTHFVVEGQVLFNSVVRLCLTELLPALHKVLGLPAPTAPQDGPHLDPTRSAHWRKVLVPMKSYLQDIIKLSNAITDEKLASVLLKHVMLLVPYYVALPQIAKTLHKRLVALWCEGGETVRILAFFCLIKTVRRLPKAYLNALLKYMYMSYVRNCKFTSPTTWPLIAFMRSSLAEMYALDQALAYQHAFLYIRQLAIHLRNAMTVKKKDTCKAVYNWQYVHCCLLWAHLLATVYPSDALEPLIYPLVQTITGSIQLIPAAKYIPLRLHLTRGLLQLTTCTRTFIPVMPHLLEVLTIVNFDRKHTAVSMRPMDLRCMLRASESQMKENGFRDAVVENFYDLTLEYVAGYSNSVAFPELVLPAVVRLKAWVKKCRVANYVRKIRQLVEKIEENAKFIEERRRSVTCKLSNTQALDLVEGKWKEEGTPLAKFYTQWEKVRGERQVVTHHRDVLTELPESESDSDRGRKRKRKKDKKETKSKKERKSKEEENVDGDRDVVRDIVLSSSEEEDDSDEASD